MGKLTSSRVTVPFIRRTSSRRSSISAILLMCLAIHLSSPATAQSAAKTSKPQAKSTGPISNTPSRLIGPAELNAYLESISSALLIRGRKTDPFGQFQDLDAKPIPKAPVAGPLKRAAPILATPFPEIIRMIVVTTIMPGEKRFLIGTRSIKQGDQIPITFHGKQLHVQVTEVTSHQIGFRNSDTGEIALRKLDMLPPGMTPGNHQVVAPGMVADRLNSPIDLDAGSSASP